MKHLKRLSIFAIAYITVYCIFLVVEDSTTYPPIPPERSPMAGISTPIEASRGDYERQTFDFEVTAYCLKGRTKTGTVPTEGRTVAVDPDVIPLGSTVYVEGVGELKAEDTGRMIRGNRLDLYLDKYADCVEWGRRTVKVRWISD